MSPDEIATARRMRHAGASDKAIAAAMVPPVTRQHVHAVLGARRRGKGAQPSERVKAPRVSREGFAARLKVWRARHGLTQSEAAKRLRVGQATLGFWETQHCGCSLAAALCLLMDLLDKESVQ